MASVTQLRARPPSVEAVLTEVRSLRPQSTNPDALADAVREIVADERDRLAAGAEPTAIPALARQVVERLDGWSASPVVRTINATGVILHTNLGRAPWPEEAIEAARAAAGSYCSSRSTGRPAGVARGSGSPSST
jgi:L-seryl-tRNA(Ser) seleniumtransferase